MKTLQATYRIVTPMFIGDAEQKATDLRPPSIKGALRFWWRALNWKLQFHNEPRVGIGRDNTIRTVTKRLTFSNPTCPSNGSSSSWCHCKRYCGRFTTKNRTNTVW
jgi:hypothetical protein